MFWAFFLFPYSNTATGVLMALSRFIRSAGLKGWFSCWDFIFSLCAVSSIRQFFGKPHSCSISSGLPKLNTWPDGSLPSRRSCSSVLKFVVEPFCSSLLKIPPTSMWKAGRNLVWYYRPISIPLARSWRLRVWVSFSLLLAFSHWL